jgi:hypothetical protein
VGELRTPFEEAFPAPCIAPLLRRRNPCGHEPAHDDLSRLAFVGASLDQEVDHGGAPGEQDLARRALLAPVGHARPLRLRHELTEARLKRDERLQILLRNPLLGELGDDHMKALGAERERVLALSIVAMGPPQCLSAAPMRSTDGESVCMAAILVKRNWPILEDCNAASYPTG